MPLGAPSVFQSEVPAPVSLSQVPLPAFLPERPWQATPLGKYQRGPTTFRRGLTRLGRRGIPRGATPPGQYRRGRRPL